MRTALTSLTVSGLLLATPLCAQDGSASAGARLVASDCARCHAREPGVSSTDPGAPNLADVANMPSATDLSLRVFLSSSHRSMPNVVLTEAEIADVIAYLRGLRR